MTFDLQIDPPTFAAVKSGVRSIEHKNDQNFRLGDLVTLREFNASAWRYTGRTLTARILGLQCTERHEQVLITFGEPMADEVSTSEQ